MPKTGFRPYTTKTRGQRRLACFHRDAKQALYLLTIDIPETHVLQ